MEPSWRGGYIRDNPWLVNYARRHHKGLPISSSIAESAVKEVVSLRMAKKRQMRWSDERAHLLAQVRVRRPLLDVEASFRRFSGTSRLLVTPLA